MIAVAFTGSLGVALGEQFRTAEPRGVAVELGALFCDQVGSTALLTQLGNALAEEIRRDIFVALYQAAELSRGEVVKSSGDGLMVIFRAGADDAILCGQIMLRKINRLRASELFEPVQFKVGVSVGDAIYDRDDWYGAAINMAARSCAAAGPGQLLVSESACPAWQAQTGGWHTQPPLTLKGFPAPEPVLSWEPPTHRQLRPLSVELDTQGSLPLVGRAKALETIAAAARAEAFAAVRLTAAPGGGLSRVLAEAANGCDGVVLYASSRSDSSVVGQLIRSYAATATMNELREAAGPDAGGLAALCPLVGLRLSVVPAASPVPDELIVRFVGRIASRTPVLILLDDIGADKRWQLQSRCTVVHGIRTDTPVDAALWLQPLNTAEIGLLVADAVPAGRSWWSSLVEVIAAETDGVVRDVVAVLDELTRSARQPEHLQPKEAFDAVRRAVPYRGLQVFAADDAVRFHGRERAIQDVTSALQTASFVAVVGSSGSGKSSVVRAGCLPRLQADGVDVVVMAPGENPLTTLAAAWSEPAGAAALLNQLHQDPTALTSTEHAGQDRLLAIDQLEEAFTLCTGDAERDQFLRVITHPVPGLRVLATLRGDFFGRASEHPELAEALRGGTVLMPPPTKAELRSMVETPAGQAHLRLEPGLSDLILTDVTDRPGSLPLLSHALRETWRRRHGSLLAVRDYQAAGGATGAIARTADTVFDQLSESEQQIAKRIFLRLTALGEGVEDSRRRVPADVLTATGTSDAVGVLATLTSARLITADTDAEGQDVDELAHEALLREWPRLRGWLDEDREQLTILAHLEAAARDWNTAGRSDSELYAGRRLEAAEEIPVERLNQREQAYIQASLARRAAQRRAARRNTRRLQTLVVVLVVLLVAAGLAGVIAVQQRGQARKDATRAQEQTQVASARALDAQSQAQLVSQPARSALLAAEAENTHDSLQARVSLFAAVYHDPHLTRIATGFGQNMADVNVGGIMLPRFNLTPDAKLAAVVGEDGTSVQVFDFRTVQPLGAALSLGGAGVQYVAWSSNHLLAVLFDNRRVVAWNADSGRRVAELVVPKNFDLSDSAGIDLSPDGKTLLLQSVANGGFLRWSLPSGAPIGKQIRLGSFADQTFTPDGKSITLSDSRGLDTIDPITARPIRAPLDITTNYEFDYTGDGTKIMVGQRTGPPFIIDARTGKRLETFAFPAGYQAPDSLNDGGSPSGVDISPDGRYVAYLDHRGTLIVWRVSDGRIVDGQAFTSLLGQDADSFLYFTPDSRQLVFGNGYEVATWTIAIKGLLAKGDLGTSQDVSPTAFVDRPRNRLIVEGYDGLIRVYDLKTLALRSIHDFPSSADGFFVAVDPLTGEVVASESGTFGAAGTVAFYDPTRPDDPLKQWTVAGNVYGAIFSPDGRKLAVAVNVGQPFSPGPGYLEIIDRSNPAQPRKVRVDSAGANTVAWSSDGARVLVGGRSRLVSVDAATLKVLGSQTLPKTRGTFGGGTAIGRFVDLGPSRGQVFATTNQDKILTFRAIGAGAKGLPTLTLSGTSSLSAPASGDLLAEGGISFFSGTPLDGAATTLSLSALPSGEQLVTGLPYDGTTMFIDNQRLLVLGQQDAVTLTLDPKELINMACSIAGRNLTKAEFADFAGAAPYRKTCPQFPAGS